MSVKLFGKMFADRKNMITFAAELKNIVKNQRLRICIGR